jgi:hypothetical protein
MDNRAIRLLKKALIPSAVFGLFAFSAIEFRVIALKEGGYWFSEHNWGEFTLAVLPNLIAGLLAFVLVYIFVERRDERKRYIEAMRTVRATIGANREGLSDERVQRLMVPMVQAISLLYFGTAMPRASGNASDPKASCTLCPEKTCGQENGRCVKCNEIPECWSLKELVRK